MHLKCSDPVTLYYLLFSKGVEGVENEIARRPGQLTGRKHYSACQPWARTPGPFVQRR